MLSLVGCGFDTVEFQPQHLNKRFAARLMYSMKSVARRSGVAFQQSTTPGLWFVRRHKLRGPAWRRPVLAAQRGMILPNEANEFFAINRKILSTDAGDWR